MVLTILSASTVRHCDLWGRYDDAIPDFEAVLKLNKDMAVAHVNLGLIYMLKLDNYHRCVCVDDVIALCARRSRHSMRASVSVKFREKCF